MSERAADCGPATPPVSARPDWDTYGLQGAIWASGRADCRRARHGALIMDQDHRTVASGYNGSPPGGPSCLAGECPRGLATYEQLPGQMAGNHDYSNCVANHAEANALLYASRQDTVGATMYITGRPCMTCWKLIQGAGIARVVWPAGVVEDVGAMRHPYDL